MLDHVALVVIGSLVLYLFYQTFITDMIANKIKVLKERSANKTTAEKVAQVKMLSDDPKDIEKFITNNAKYLSDGIVKQLVARIDLIKCDRVIAEDSIRKRIASLPQDDELTGLSISEIMRKTHG
jgi:hypothetical protein